SEIQSTIPEGATMRALATILAALTLVTSFAGMSSTRGEERPRFRVPKTWMPDGRTYAQPEPDLQLKPLVITHATVIDATAGPAAPDMTVVIASAEVEDGKKVYHKYVELTGAMHRAGVRFLAGTDTSENGYCFPGFSLHDELALLVEAGLKPMEALRAATS